MTSARYVRGSATPLQLHGAGVLPLRGATRTGLLLREILGLQDAANLKSVAARAAGAFHRLTGAPAAAAWISTASESEFATAGELSTEKAEHRALALMKLAAAGNARAGRLEDEAGTLAVPFHSDLVRGALGAGGLGLLFGEAEERLASHLARQVGARAAAIVMANRLRQVEGMDAAVADTVAEGVLEIRDRKVALMSPSASRLLGIDSSRAQGKLLNGFWPELAQAMDSGQPLDGAPMQLEGKALSVTLRSFPEGPWPSCAVAIFTPVPSAPVDASRVAGSSSAFAGMVGVSQAIAEVREVARLAAQSSSSVLIEGGSGVGKEVLAQAIHAEGPRRGQPMVAVLCTAIPRELLESELFGYEAGSFTGASPRGRAGKFELAHGGTLLLDEIVDMPIELQAKLLRVLQENAVTRLGGQRPRRVDVRVLATANRPVAEAVREGRFRADLYYRVNVLNIVIPPLARRREDIKPLAEHFLRKHALAHGSNLKTLGSEALRALQSYSWPGSAGELDPGIETETHSAPPASACLRKLSRKPIDAPESAGGPRTLQEMERQLVVTAVAEASGDISRAARALGISRGKLYRKLRLYDAGK